MIEISEDLRNHFLEDSTTNNLVINARTKGNGSVDYTNYYTGDVETYSEIIKTRAWGFLANRFPEDYSFKKYVDMRYFANRPYVCISFNIHITSYTSLPEYLNVAIYFHTKDGAGRWFPLANAIKTSEYLNAPKRFYYTGPTNAGAPYEIEYFEGIDVNIPEGEPDFLGTITVSDYQFDLVESADETPRNYDITLKNDDIVFESMTYKESLCSKDNLKFGLCEASNIEVSVVNNNILNDSRVRVYIEDGDGVNKEQLFRANWHYDISGNMRPDTVFNNTRTGVGNILWSTHWLYDTDVAPFSKYAKKYGYFLMTGRMRITSIVSNNGGPLPTYVVPWGRVDYSDGTYHDRNHNTTKWYSLSQFTSGDQYFFISLPYIYNGAQAVKIIRQYFQFYDENRVSMQNCDFDISATYKEFGVYVSDSPQFKYIPFDPEMCIVYNDTVEEFEESIKLSVPLGTFKVSNVKSKIDHLVETKTLTAYDYILRLEQNAADWYTQYMFGLSSIGYTGEGFEFSRQIYSTFFDYMRKATLEYRDNYNVNLIGDYDKADILANHLSSKRLFYHEDRALDFRCAEFNVSGITSRRYCVLNTFDTDIGTIKDWIREYDDPLCRGIVSANILIEETRSNHPKNRYCVDSGDFFMVSPDCTSFKVYIACYFENTDTSAISLQILKDVQILEVIDPIDLENGHIRLMFYDWNTKEIFPCETSITGRDVVRSLLEPCGCFFRLNRETNIPEFVYCTKGGLYPAENLYPADDLYPRAGTDTVIPTGKYISFERGETEVQNFGRIQIKKGGATNETEPICQWEYIGDANELNTYIIDDNIFYCSENMVYNQNMIEVSEMIQNMWYRISNMGYVSNVTQALGMPWIECGDRIGILTMTGGAETFVFRRTLKGIQLLKDTYESNGDEYVKAISNYNYGG